MAQIATLLSADGQRRFGYFLISSADRLRSASRSRLERREIEGRICEALSQSSLYRLRAYANGKHFPTPKVVSKLASALGIDQISLLMMAGYQREILWVLQRLYLASCKHGEHAKDLKRAAIAYAVLVFPRRGERYRPDAGPWEEIDLTLRAAAGYAYTVGINEPRQRITVRPLRIAHECLGEKSIAIETERRRVIAGELVRSWAYDVDAEIARDAEVSTYLPTCDACEAMPSHPKLLPIFDATSLIAEEGAK